MALVNENNHLRVICASVADESYFLVVVERRDRRRRFVHRVASSSKHIAFGRGTGDQHDNCRFSPAFVFTPIGVRSTSARRDGCNRSTRVLNLRRERPHQFSDVTLTRNNGVASMSTSSGWLKLKRNECKSRVNTTSRERMANRSNLRLSAGLPERSGVGRADVRRDVMGVLCSLRKRKKVRLQNALV